MLYKSNRCSSFAIKVTIEEYVENLHYAAVEIFTTICADAKVAEWRLTCIKKSMKLLKCQMD